MSKDPSREPNKASFSTLLALLWVTFERIGSLPPQHFALSMSSRHLVAKDCIHQLLRWKANKSFPPPCCPTPTLGMKCNVMSELSLCLEPSVTLRLRSLLALLWAEEKEWTLCLGAWEGFTITAILAAQLLTLLSEPLLGGPHCTLRTSKG